MKAPFKQFLTTLVGVLGLTLAPTAGHASNSWVVYYSDAAPVETLFPYQLIVLDSHYHPPLAPLQEKNKTLLGYISLGEVEHQRPYFERVKKMGILHEENVNWQGSFFVDVRDPRWAALVVEELIPDILQQGFDGIFLDTLDNPADLERRKPEIYKGMQDASARLVKEIRRHYPKIPIMINRAYEILPDVAGDVDMVLAECLYTCYNFEDKVYEKTPTEFYEGQLKTLKDLQSEHPKLEVYSLDYWSPEDTETIQQIYALQRRNKFHPYVSTIELNQVISEPR